MAVGGVLESVLVSLCYLGRLEVNNINISIGAI